MALPSRSSEPAGADPLAPLTPGRERLELELERARRAHRPAVMMSIAVAPPGLPDAPADLEARVRAALERELWRALDPAAAHVWRPAERVHVLLPGAALDAARQLAEGLVEAGRHLAVDGFERGLRAHVAVGLAVDDAERDWWFETLLAVAEEGLALARARGGEGVAHTELYTLCQRRVERAGPRRRVVLPDEPLPRPAVRPAAPAANAPPAPVPPLRTAPAPPAAAPPRMPAAGPGWIWPVAAPPPPAGEAAALLAAREREHRAEVERLERRIAKLMATLESTERELKALARRRAEPTGVASFYREVQGLEDDDEHYEVKAALMERILEANLELRAIVRARRELAG